MEPTRRRYPAPPRRRSDHDRPQTQGKVDEEFWRIVSRIER